MFCLLDLVCLIWFVCMFVCLDTVVCVSCLVCYVFIKVWFLVAVRLLCCCLVYLIATLLFVAFAFVYLVVVGVLGFSMFLGWLVWCYITDCYGCLVLLLIVVLLLCLVVFDCV